MKKLTKLLLYIALICIIPISSFGQKESDKLKNQQKELQKRIENTRKMLNEAKNNQRITMAELGILNQQIAYRDELINSFQQQIRNYNRKIEEAKGMIVSLEEDQKKLIHQYRSMIYAAYKNRHKHTNMMFVFSSSTFSQAWMRVKYMQKIAAFRKRQVDLIQQTVLDIAKRQELLGKYIAEKQSAAQTTEQEKHSFDSDKKKQQEMLGSLKKQESKLKQDLAQQEEKKRKLDLAIKNAIQKEIEAEQKRQAELAAKSGKKEVGLTPEAKLAEKNFEANKGILPWPVERGEISVGFGRVEHPVVKGVVINSNGWDITTPKGSAVRAVYEGEVSSILVIPGAGKAVMISHGNYRTVYANLQDVSVSKGDKISTKQVIGKLLPAEEGNNSTCHFEVWKISGTKSAAQNPSGWLHR